MSNFMQVEKGYNLSEPSDSSYALDHKKNTLKEIHGDSKLLKTSMWEAATQPITSYYKVSEICIIHIRKQNRVTSNMS